MEKDTEGQREREGERKIDKWENERERGKERFDWWRTAVYPVECGG